MQQPAVSERSLGDMFEGNDSYVVPAFQRPYMWEKEHTRDLFEDLHRTHKTERDGYYFLGSIVLARSGHDGQEQNEWQIIDGQQRLTTLTMLLATVAHLLTEAEAKSELQDYILRPGKKFRGLAAKPRLSLREMERDFFERHVQNLHLDDLSALHAMQTDSQRRIRDNCLLLRGLIEEEFCADKNIADNALADFGRFWINQCHLVVFRVPRTESAFRVFSVLNGRGLDLRASDLLKAEIMGKLPDDAHDRFARRWEALEAKIDDVSNGGIDGLLGHIRMIHVREKQRKALLEELGGILSASAEVGHDNFMEKVFHPCAFAYLTAKNANYAAEQHAEQINHLLGWLNLIDNSDWLPPAIAFLARPENTPEQTLRFFTQLERLAAALMVCGKNASARISVYADVLRALSRDKVDSALSIMDNQDAIGGMKLALDGDVYNLPPRRRSYVIRRLESFISAQRHTLVKDMQTIEHVLPQTIPNGSQWKQWWPDEDEARGQMHRVANLVPLPRRRNSQARNFEFGKKKSAYFAGYQNVPNYALTAQVLQEKEWTPAVVQKRQQALMAVFAREWKLDQAEA